jgi:Zn-dependent protease
MENQAIETIFFFAVLIFSVIIHEISHGAVALRLGDATAKSAGRLTLNPLKHIDPFGSLILPAILIFLRIATGGGIIFGWAKPVPVNHLNFKNPRWGMFWTGLAGPLSNVVLALVFAVLIRFAIPVFPYLVFLAPFFAIVVLLNLWLGVINLVPIPPLDGSRIFFSLFPLSQEMQLTLERYSIFFLVFLLFFFMPIVSEFVFFLFRVLIGAPIPL